MNIHTYVVEVKLGHDSFFDVFFFLFQCVFFTFSRGPYCATRIADCPAGVLSMNIHTSVVEDSVRLGHDSFFPVSMCFSSPFQRVFLAFL